MTDQENPSSPPTPPNRRGNRPQRGRDANRRDRQPRPANDSAPQPSAGSRWRDPRTFRSVREREEQDTGRPEQEQNPAETQPGAHRPAAPSGQRSQQRRGDRRPAAGAPQGQNKPADPSGSPARENFRSQPKRPLLGNRRQQEEQRPPRSKSSRDRQQPTAATPVDPASRETTPAAQTGKRRGTRRAAQRSNLQPRPSVDPKKLRPTLSNRALKSLMRGPKRVFNPGKAAQDSENDSPPVAPSGGEPGAPVYRSLSELLEADRKARSAAQPTTANSAKQSGKSRQQRGMRGPQRGTGAPFRAPQDPRPAPSIPIPTTRGIKARDTRGQTDQNWWARRWIESMETIVDAHRLQRGRTYARDGQVLSIEESPYGVESRVQGSRREPYKVTFQLTPLTDEQWEQVIDALAEQARFTAQLLAGEMPADIETAFESAGVSLFPQTAGDLYTSCSCPDWANPCKHVAATHYILGDRFDDDPFLLFRMRGRTQEQILDALRRRRSTVEPEIPTEAPLEEIVPPPAAAPVASLPVDPNAFWDAAAELENLPLAIKPPTVDMPVLKRLGQPAFLPGLSLQELLAPVYQSFTYSALRAAYSEEAPVERSADDEASPTNGNGHAAPSSES